MGLFTRYIGLNEAKMSADEIRAKYYSDMDERLFRAAVNADPTRKGDGIGKYTKWLLELARNGKWKAGDAYETTKALSKFAKYGQKMDRKDISEYESVGDLINAQEEKGEVKTRSDVKAEAEKVYEDSWWAVYHPMTEEAAKLYGKGTRWCTSGNKDNRFNEYNEGGPIYIIINKQDPSVKYQFHVASEQFMDAMDEPLETLDEIKDDTTDGLFNWIETVDPELTFMPSRRLRACVENFSKSGGLDCFDDYETFGNVYKVRASRYYNLVDRSKKNLLLPWCIEIGDFHCDRAKVEYIPDMNIASGEGLIVVETIYEGGSINTNVNYIDLNGHVIYHGDTPLCDGSEFNDGVVGVYLQYNRYNPNTANVMDVNGNFLFKENFYDVRFCNSKYLIVTVREPGESRRIAIDYEGNNLSNKFGLPDLSYISNDGMALFKDTGEKSGILLSPEGRPIPNVKVSSIKGDLHDGYIIIGTEDDKMNYVDINGNLLLKQGADKCQPVSEGVAAFLMGDKYHLLTIDGHEINNNGWTKVVQNFYNGYAFVCDDNHNGWYIDHNGRRVSDVFRQWDIFSYTYPPVMYLLLNNEEKEYEYADKQLIKGPQDTVSESRKGLFSRYVTF